MSRISIRKVERATQLVDGNTVVLEAHVDFSLAEMAMEQRVPKGELIRSILEQYVDENYLSPSVSSAMRETLAKKN